MARTFHKMVDNLILRLYDDMYKSVNNLILRIAGISKPMPFMIDLCAGLGGASEAFRARGWEVLTVELEPAFKPDVVADVRTWQWWGKRPDFIWASPPCTEFARESMPWCKTGNTPDLSLVNACKRIISECNPRFWCLENVRGARPYLGTPRVIVGPFFLWGFFPAVTVSMAGFRKKESYGSKQRAERAKVPYALSLAMCEAVESARVLI